MLKYDILIFLDDMYPNWKQLSASRTCFKMTEVLLTVLHAYQVDFVCQNVRGGHITQSSSKRKMIENLF